jgi:PAS domain S-box-containing protein
MSTDTSGREHGLGAEDRSTDEANYRALVENLPAVIYQVAPDDDRRTMYVSRHVETALGYSRGEWLDQPDIWMELLHPDDREPTLAAHDLHNETGRPWSREYRLIANDGREVWFRDVATLVARTPDGRPSTGWASSWTSPSSRRRSPSCARRATSWSSRVAERTAELEEANALMALEIGERRRAESGPSRRRAPLPACSPSRSRPSRTCGRRTARRTPSPAYYTSPRIEQLLGYTVEEWHVTADFWISRLHPDDRHRVLAAFLAIRGHRGAVRARVPLPAQERPHRMGRPIRPSRSRTTMKVSHGSSRGSCST